MPLPLASPIGRPVCVRAGDVVIFGMHTLHMSTANIAPGGRIRLSVDVRWQPAGDVIDDRYMGATSEEMARKQAERKRSGVWVKDGRGSGGELADPTSSGTVTMADLRERWGI